MQLEIPLALACAITGFGLVLHTTFFIMKLLRAGRPDSSSSGWTGPTSEKDPLVAMEQQHTFSSVQDDGVYISQTELACFMGWAWNCAVDPVTRRMSRNMFYLWYLVVLSIDAAVGGLVFLMFFYLVPS